MTFEAGGVVHSFEADINRLRELLHEYDRKSILKELIQNAEDAKASELKIIYFSNSSEEHNNPLLDNNAILILNNGSFNSKDKESIRRLNLGAKDKNNTSIGKFGLGLKSVFNFCDAFFYCASIIENSDPDPKPFVGIFNPWYGDGCHDSYNKFKECDCDFITEKIKEHILKDNWENWFCLWLPIRNLKKFDREQYLADWAPAVDEFKGLFNDSAIPLAMPLLHNLKKIDVNGKTFSISNNKTNWLELTDTTAMPVNGTIEIDEPSKSPEYSFSGLQCLLEPPSDSTPRKHIAVVFVYNSDGDDGLEIVESAFLPISKCEGKKFTMILHGNFYLDSGRTIIQTESNDQNQDFVARASWNIELLNGLYELILPTLEKFAKTLEDKEVANLTARLLESNLFKAHSKEICVRNSWAYSLCNNKYALFQSTTASFLVNSSCLAPRYHLPTDLPVQMIDEDRSMLMAAHTCWTDAPNELKEIKLFPGKQLSDNTAKAYSYNELFEADAIYQEDTTEFAKVLSDAITECSIVLISKELDKCLGLKKPVLLPKNVISYLNNSPTLNTPASRLILIQRMCSLLENPFNTDNTELIKAIRYLILGSDMAPDTRIVAGDNGTRDVWAQLYAAISNHPVLDQGLQPLLESVSKQCLSFIGIIRITDISLREVIIQLHETPAIEKGWFEHLSNIQREKLLIDAKCAYGNQFFRELPLHLTTQNEKITLYANPIYTQAGNLIYPLPDSRIHILAAPDDQNLAQIYTDVGCQQWTPQNAIQFCLDNNRQHPGIFSDYIRERLRNLHNQISDELKSRLQRERWLKINERVLAINVLIPDELTQFLPEEFWTNVTESELLKLCESIPQQLIEVITEIVTYQNCAFNQVLAVLESSAKLNLLANDSPRMQQYIRACSPLKEHLPWPIKVLCNAPQKYQQKLWEHMVGVDQNQTHFMGYIESVLKTIVAHISNGNKDDLETIYLWHLETLASIYPDDAEMKDLTFLDGNGQWKRSDQLLALWTCSGLGADFVAELNSCVPSELALNNSQAHAITNILLTQNNNLHLEESAQNMWSASGLEEYLNGCEAICGHALIEMFRAIIQLNRYNYNSPPEIYVANPNNDGIIMVQSVAGTPLSIPIPTDTLLVTRQHNRFYLIPPSHDATLAERIIRTCVFLGGNEQKLRAAANIAQTNLENAIKYTLKCIPRYFEELQFSNLDGSTQEMRNLVQLFHTGQFSENVVQPVVENINNHSAILEAVRKRIKETFQYAAESVLFELFQNADDAYVQLATLNRTSDGKITITNTDGVLSVVHWGRKINEYIPVEGAVLTKEDCKKLDYDKDLTRMLTMGASSKKEGSTGKFGLGFKSVFLYSDAPEIFSGNLCAVRILGGVWPQSIEIPTGYNCDTTLIRLPARTGNSSTGNELITQFQNLLPFTLAFAHKIKSCDLTGQEYKWQEDKIVEGVFNATYVTPKQYRRFLVFRNPQNLYESLFFELDQTGIKKMPADVPTFWVTVPTQEKLDTGFLLNADFGILPSRTQIAVEVEATEKVINSFKKWLGTAMETLHNTSSNKDALFKSIYQAVLCNGCTSNYILKAIFWDKDSTFQTFYLNHSDYKPTEDECRETLVENATNQYVTRASVCGLTERAESVRNSIQTQRVIPNLRLQTNTSHTYWTGRLYGNFGTIMTADKLRAYDKKAWRVLLLRGAMESIGAWGGADGTCQDFMNVCDNNRFLEDNPPQTRLASLRRWLDEAQNDGATYNQQIRSFMVFLLYDEWLDAYSQNILAAANGNNQHVPGVIRYTAPIFNPRLNINNVGGGPDAPGMRFLGMGAHFVLRELVRLGAVENAQIHPMCFVPYGPICDMLQIDRRQPHHEKACQIHNWAAQHRGNDSTFDNHFDLVFTWDNR